MSVQKLTIDQARANAANFMYVFASDAFLKAIPSTPARIITGKKANQNKLLMLSAKEYGSTYEAYVEAVRDGFMEQYGMMPGQALVVLAQGGDVAGKNWKDGVYGVGTISVTRKFAGTNVTVDKTTGVISENGVALATTNTVAENVRGKTIANYQISAKASDGNVYVSQYSRVDGTYYAKSYTNAEGRKYNAYGTAISGADAATVWESVILSLQDFIEWLINLFTGGESNTEKITAANTLPNQKTDGWAYKSGFGEAGTILLVLAAGGALMASGAFKGKKKASNK